MRTQTDRHTAVIKKLEKKRPVQKKNQHYWLLNSQSLEGGGEGRPVGARKEEFRSHIRQAAAGPLLAPGDPHTGVLHSHTSIHK